MKMTANPHSVAILQARMGSSRLPGKVLLDIAGKPMLARVMERTRRSALVDEVVVATSTEASDDPIEGYCLEHGYPCLRGSQFDVLDRFFQVASKLQAGIVVRITADCPVIDPDIVDLTLQEFMQADVDFAANRLPPPFRRTFPIGLDVEICKFEALERAWEESTLPYHREHVMPFLYEDVVLKVIDTTHSLGISRRGFRVLLLNQIPDYGSLRWTVDTPADLEFIRRVFAHFGGQDDFSWRDLLALVQENPDLAMVNAGIRPKNLQDFDARGTKN
jgi:spore coat polysaccharide biosynthesis protein SpsF